MPRPDSGFLSGVLAGINQFKQTKQFYEQMESTNLQQEATRAQLDAFKQQQADYMSPQAQIDARTQAEREREQELYDLGQARQPLEDERKLAFMQKELELRSKYTQPKATATLTADEALKDIHEYAKQQGIEIPGGAAEVSLDTLNEAVKFAQAGEWGEALTVVRADKLGKLPELDWMLKLPDDAKAFARNWLLAVSSRAPTSDMAIQEMNKLRIQFEQNRIIQPRTNIWKGIQEWGKGGEINKSQFNAPMSPQRYLMPKQGPSGA